MAPAKKNEKSGVGEDFAEIKGYIADIRGSIAEIHEKLGLLDLIAQKLLGGDAGKKVEDVKKQQEQETLAYEDSNQIVSHLGEYPSNIDPIMDQIQRSLEEKKPTEEEIQTSKETESVVGESRKGVDQILCLGQRVTTTEATTVAKEEEPREHNHKPKKKKKKKRKRWKKCLLMIWKFLVVNRRSRKKENISLSYGNEWSGFYSIKMKVTLQVEKEKQRKAKSDGYADHVLDIMLMRRKLVTKKSKRKKKKVTNKKKKRTRRMEHMGVKHFSVEEQFEYKAVLFVPKGAPFDPFDPGKKPNNIMLDVHHDFIMDCSEEIISEYLGFVKGIEYSEELPLNISKETLKQNKLIRKNRGKKCSELFLEIAKTKMGCAGKGLKHKKKMYKRLYGKLLWKYRSDMKQLVKWKGWSFKPKHYMSKKNIKERLSGNQIVCLWNYKLGQELFRKIFSQWWCKKKRGCVRAYWRFSNNLVYSPLKLTLELKFHRIILKATMKHKRTILQEACVVLILSKISYNSISVEMIICMGILTERTTDVLLLGLDSSYEMLRLQWLETWKDLGVKLEELEDENKEMEEIKDRIEGMCKVINDVLEDKVEVVIVSDRVVDSPCYLVTCDYRWTADVKRNVKAQALGDSSMSSDEAIEPEAKDPMPIIRKGPLTRSATKALRNQVNEAVQSLLSQATDQEQEQVFIRMDSSTLFSSAQKGLTIYSITTSSGSSIGTSSGSSIDTSSSF